MPTPVSVARQCLTPEASRALDEAVAVARRRNHPQTTSLHALSAILSFPSSALRDACSRVRSNTYSSRLQFRALELCFSSALDRLPSSQPQEEPPISNSFMAAIKRSQANQRRHPEAFQFHLHQQQQSASSSSSSSSLSCVKVELQQLILSILDDPVVSRVFAEAGFGSCDLKLAILRPPPPILSRYPRSRRPPLFLCNLPESESNRRTCFSFPFLGFSERDDTTCRRIGEVLISNKGRNPLVIGVSAMEAVKNFGEIIQSGKTAGILPGELSGLTFLSIDKELVSESGREELLCSKLVELENYSTGFGLVVSVGDLKVFVDDASRDVLSYVVAQLTKLLLLHRGKLWLLGAAESYDMYSKFLIMFPSLDKDWDLQLLSISSVRNPLDGGFQPRPHRILGGFRRLPAYAVLSLTESFVPFGGFFSTPSDPKGPLSSTYLHTSRCDMCNQKYEQEVSAIVKGSTLSLADQYQESLPSWMQMAELNARKGLDVAKAKDDGTILNAKVSGLQKKWNDICQRLNHLPRTSEADMYQARPQTFTGTMGFPSVVDRKEQAYIYSSTSSITVIPNQSEYQNVLSEASPRSQMTFEPNQKTGPIISGAKNENPVGELVERPSKSGWVLTEGLQFSAFSPDSSMLKGRVSPCHASVTTDLGLGTIYATHKEPNRPIFPAHKEHLRDLADCLPSNADTVNPNISDPSVQSSSFSGSDLSSQLDLKDCKSLWKSLSGKIGRQNDAIHVICQTIARCRTGNERRRGACPKQDIWFSFIGPDRVAKKRIAMALAEMIFGNQENLICVDLRSKDGFKQANTIFGFQEINDYDEKFWGKMAVDYIAEEISKKPLSIVFLESINKAELPLQNSLLQAIKTGILSDSRGRRININRAIFVTTSETIKDNHPFFEKQHGNFSEEMIAGAQSLEMEILISIIPENNIIFSNSNVLVTSRKTTSCLASMNKRKLTESSEPTELGETSEWDKRAQKTTRYLDLNLPVEEVEVLDSDCGSSNSDSLSQCSESWLEDFFNQMDETVLFEPFDFVALADRVLLEISSMFRKIIGCDGLLEIDSKVMEQILAAAWLSDRKRAVEDWVEQVLGKSFTEARQKYTFTGRPILKLASREGFFMKDQTATTICLPTRIILN